MDLESSYCDGVHAPVDVALVTMPWDSLTLPSLRLGILKSRLQTSGITTMTHYNQLLWVEQLASAGISYDPERAPDRTVYLDVVASGYRYGIGEWIFASPHLRDAPELDASFLAYLEQQPVPPRQIDAARAMRRLAPGFLAACAENILGSGTRLVGFTTGFSQTAASLSVARLIKEARPEIVTVFGGPGCHGIVGATLHRCYPWVDVVVRGEAEEVVVDLFQDLLNQRPPRPRPGICYRIGGESVSVEGSSPPAEIGGNLRPDFSEYFEQLNACSTMRDKIRPGVQIPFESSRGCWWADKSQCRFCGLNGERVPFRTRRADEVLNEIQSHANSYHILRFRAVDNIISPAIIDELAPIMNRAGADFEIYYETRATLSKEQLYALRSAGVTELHPGIESLSTPILALMAKGTSTLHNIRQLKWLKELGIGASWNLIHGIPGETADHYREIADLIPSLTHLAPPNVNPLHLDRFSPFHEDPGRFGIRIKGPALYARYIHDLPDSDLLQLANSFEFEVDADADLLPVISRIKALVDQWKRGGSLRYRCGPDFIIISDRRPGLEHLDYVLQGLEAVIYLACDEGARAEDVAAEIAATSTCAIDVDEIRDFLGQLVECRLMFRERQRYLSLATHAGSAAAVASRLRMQHPVSLRFAGRSRSAGPSSNLATERTPTKPVPEGSR
ncbi:MAG: RiPP maturation radical SAM C-methyltransferase [Candidatus Krumholzibacteriia bacterium]